MPDVKAPFSPAQVAALAAWQRYQAAFVCPKHGLALAAETAGLRCRAADCAHLVDVFDDIVFLPKYCTRERPYDAVTAQPNEYWVHVDALFDPDYDGDHLPCHCNSCGLDFIADLS